MASYLLLSSPRKKKIEIKINLIFTSEIKRNHQLDSTVNILDLYLIFFLPSNEPLHNFFEAIFKIYDVISEQPFEKSSDTFNETLKRIPFRYKLQTYPSSGREIHRQVHKV